MLENAPRERCAVQASEERLPQGQPHQVVSRPREKCPQHGPLIYRRRAASRRVPGHPPLRPMQSFSAVWRVFRFLLHTAGSNLDLASKKTLLGQGMFLLRVGPQIDRGERRGERRWQRVVYFAMP